MKPCPHCEGTGKVPDHVATGESYRRLREATGKSLRSTALQMGISAPYLSDLERGRRNWTPKLRKALEKVI